MKGCWMDVSEMKKKDLSKLEKKEKKAKKKKKDKFHEDAKKIDFSKLSDAEYEELFLRKFSEKIGENVAPSNNTTQIESDQNNNIEVINKAPYFESESNNVALKPKPKIVLKEISYDGNSQSNLSSKSLNSTTNVENISPSNNGLKYGVLADFSWMAKPIQFIRHCPRCNNFMKTDNPGDLKCPKCNTLMLFSIHCKSCNLWFDVKSSKKYPCPRCGQIISHGT